MIKPSFLKLETIEGDDILVNTAAIAYIESVINIIDEEGISITQITLMDGRKHTIGMYFADFVDTFILEKDLVQATP